MKKHFTTTRILSGLLSAAMVVTMAPQTALSSFAQEDAPEDLLTESVSAPEEEAGTYDAAGDAETLSGSEGDLTGTEETDTSESWEDSELAILSSNSATTHVAFFKLADGTATRAEEAVLSADKKTITNPTKFNSYYGYSFYVVPEVGYELVDAPVTVSGKYETYTEDNSGVKTTVGQYEINAADLEIKDLQVADMPAKDHDVADGGASILSKYEAGKFSWNDGKKVTIRGIAADSYGATGSAFMAGYIKAQQAAKETSGTTTLNYVVTERLNIAPASGDIATKKELTVPVKDATETAGTTTYRDNAVKSSAAVTYGEPAEISLGEQAWTGYSDVSVKKLTTTISTGKVTSADAGTALAKTAFDSLWESSYSKNATTGYYYVDRESSKIYLNAYLTKMALQIPNEPSTTQTYEMAIVLKTQGVYKVTAVDSSRVDFTIAASESTRKATDNIRLYTSANGDHSTAVITKDAKNGNQSISVLYDYVDEDGHEIKGQTAKAYDANGNQTSVINSIAYWEIDAATGIAGDVNIYATSTEGLQITDAFYYGGGTEAAVNYKAYTTTGGKRNVAAMALVNLNYANTKLDGVYTTYGQTSAKDLVFAGEDVYLYVYPKANYQVSSVTAKIYNTAGTEYAEETLTAREEGYYLISNVRGFVDITLNTATSSDPCLVTYVLDDDAVVTDVASATTGIIKGGTGLIALYGTRGKDYFFHANAKLGHRVTSVKATIDGKTETLTAEDVTTGLYKVDGSKMSSSVTIEVRTENCVEFYVISDDAYVSVEFNDGDDLKNVAAKNGDLVQTSGDNDVTLSIRTLNGAKIVHTLNASGDDDSGVNDGVVMVRRNITINTYDYNKAITRENGNTADYASHIKSISNPGITEISESKKISGDYTIAESNLTAGNRYDIYILTNRDAVQGKDFDATFRNGKGVDVTETGITLNGGGLTVGEYTGTYNTYSTWADVRASMVVYEADGTTNLQEFYFGAPIRATKAAVADGRNWYLEKNTDAKTGETTNTYHSGMTLYASGVANIGSTGNKFQRIYTGAYCNRYPGDVLDAIYYVDAFPHSTTYTAKMNININPLSDYYKNKKLAIETYTNTDAKLSILQDKTIRWAENDQAVIYATSKKDANTANVDLFDTLPLNPVTKVDWTVAADAAGNMGNIFTSATKTIGGTWTDALSKTTATDANSIKISSATTAAQTIKVTGTVTFADNSTSVLRDELHVIDSDLGYFAVPTVTVDGTSAIRTTAADGVVEIETGGAATTATVSFDIYHAKSGGSAYMGALAGLETADKIKAALEEGQIEKVSASKIVWDNDGDGVELKSTTKTYGNYVDITGEKGTYTITAKAASNAELPLSLDATIGDFKVVIPVALKVNVKQGVTRHTVTFTTVDEKAQSNNYKYPALKSTYAPIVKYTDEWTTNTEEVTMKSTKKMAIDTLRTGVKLTDVPAYARFKLPTEADFGVEESIDGTTSTPIDPKRALYGWKVEGAAGTYNAANPNYFKAGTEIVVDEDLTITPVWAYKYVSRIDTNGKPYGYNSIADPGSDVGKVLVINGNTIDNKTPVEIANDEVFAVGTEVPIYIGFYELNKTVTLSDPGLGEIVPVYKKTMTVVGTESEDLDKISIRVNKMGANEGGIFENATKGEVMGTNVLEGKTALTNGTASLRFTYNEGTDAIYEIEKTDITVVDAAVTALSVTAIPAALTTAATKSIEVGESTTLRIYAEGGVLVATDKKTEGSVGNDCVNLGAAKINGVGSCVSELLSYTVKAKDDKIKVTEVDDGIFTVTGVAAGTSSVEITVYDTKNNVATGTVAVDVGAAKVSISATVKPDIDSDNYVTTSETAVVAGTPATLYLGVENILKLTAKSNDSSTITATQFEVKLKRDADGKADSKYPAWGVYDNANSDTIAATKMNNLNRCDADVITVGTPANATDVDVKNTDNVKIADKIANNTANIYLKPTKLGRATLVVTTTVGTKTYSQEIDVITAGLVTLNGPSATNQLYDTKEEKELFTINATQAVSGVSGGTTIGAGKKAYIPIPFVETSSKNKTYTADLSGFNAIWTYATGAQSFIGWTGSEAKIDCKTTDVYSTADGQADTLDITVSSLEAGSYDYYAAFGKAPISVEVDTTDIVLTDAHPATDNPVTTATTTGSDYTWVSVKVSPAYAANQVKVYAEDGSLVDLADKYNTAVTKGSGETAVAGGQSNGNWNKLYLQSRYQTQGADTEATNDDVYQTTAGLRWGDGAAMLLTAHNPITSSSYTLTDAEKAGDYRTDVFGIGKIAGKAGKTTVYVDTGKEVKAITVYCEGEYEKAGKTYNKVKDENITNRSAVVGGLNHYYNTDGTLVKSATWYDASVGKYVLADAKGDQVKVDHATVQASDSKHEYDNKSGATDDAYKFTYYVENDGYLFAGGLKEVGSYTYYYDSKARKIEYSNADVTTYGTYGVYEDSATKKLYSINRKTNAAKAMGVYLLDKHEFGTWTAPKDKTKLPTVMVTFTYKASISGDTFTKTANAVVEAGEEVKTSTGSRIQYTAKATPEYPETEGGSVKDVEDVKAYNFDERGNLSNEEGAIETYALDGNVGFDWHYTKQATSATLDITAKYTVLENGVATSRTKDDSKTGVVITDGERDVEKDRISFRYTYTGLDKKEYTTSKTYVWSTGAEAETYKYASNTVEWGTFDTKTKSVKATFNILYNVTMDGSNEARQESEKLTVDAVAATVSGNDVPYTAKAKPTKDSEAKEITATRTFDVTTGERSVRYVMTGEASFDEASFKYNVPAAGATTATATITAKASYNVLAVDDGSQLKTITDEATTVTLTGTQKADGTVDLAGTFTGRDGSTKTYTKTVMFADGGAPETYTLKNNVVISGWKLASDKKSATANVRAVYAVKDSAGKAKADKDDSRTLTVTETVSSGDAKLITFIARYTRLDNKQEVTATKTFSLETGKTPGEQVIGAEGGILVEGLAEEYEYTGVAMKPAFTVVDELRGVTLALGTDYSASYKNNKNIGAQATVTITGKGNYAGKSTTATFKIVDPKAGLSDDEKKAMPVLKGAKITTTFAAMPYTGEAQYPETIAVQTKNDGTITLTGDGKGGYTSDNADKPLVVTVANNVNKGSATVLVTGGVLPNGKDSSVKKTFKITQVDISTLKDDEISVSTDELDWAVKGAIPEVSVSFNSQELVEGQDYKLSYKNNKKAGQATVTISGKGNFKSKATKNFTVKALNLADATVAAVNAYAGLKQKSVKVTLLDKMGDVIPASRYTVTATGGSDKLVSGETITVAVAAKSNASAMVAESVETTAEVKTNLATKFKATIAKNWGKTYTGEPVELEAEDFTSGNIKITVNGTALELDKDFEITGYTNNLKKGTMKVTLQGTGDYSGTKQISVKILAKSILK